MVDSATEVLPRTEGLGLTDEQLEAAVEVGFDKDFLNAAKQELADRKKEEHYKEIAARASLWSKMSGFLNHGLLPEIKKPADNVVKITQDTKDAKAEILAKLPFGNEQPGFINLSLASVDELKTLIAVASFDQNKLLALVKYPHLLGKVIADQLSIGDISYGGHCHSHEFVKPDKTPEFAIPVQEVPDLPPLPNPRKPKPPK